MLVLVDVEFMVSGYPSNLLMSFVSLSYMLLFLLWPKLGLALLRMPPAALSIETSFSSELDSSARRLGLFRRFALKGLWSD